MSVEQRFEYATAADPSLNYCLWTYPPPALPEDKFRSVNLLFHSFEHAALNPDAFAVVEAIRDAIGPFQTVFGVKLIDGKLAWEFYFYDYARRRRNVSIGRVLKAISPWMPTSVAPNENLPYFMFSLDLSDAYVSGRVPLDVVHMYVGNPGSTVSSGIAYAVRDNTTVLENFYFFFDAPSQLADVAKKVASSAVFDASALPIETIIVPELSKCRTICVANKQSHDCIYFSGVNIEQLIWFLEHLRYPIAIVTFVKRYKGMLDHLLFDVGFDYKTHEGGLRILKSGYYGVF